MNNNITLKKNPAKVKENNKSESEVFDLAVKALSPESINEDLTKEQKTYAELFRSRFNFICGLSETEDGTSVSWTTAKWKLSDSELFVNWEEPNKYRGVGFQSKGTYYALLDVDKGSEYHPNYGFGFKPMERMETCLKSIGINRVNWYHSSGSGGYHGYIPFNSLVPTWATACILEMVLTEAGFVVKAGQLEIFPNTKSSKDANYKCHRLPLQNGFAYDEGYNDRHVQLKYFLEEWQESAAVNDSELFISHAEESQIWLKKHRRITNAFNNDCKKERNTRVLSKWRDDYQEVLTAGWTDRGQSQGIFCSVVKWNRVFNNEANTIEDLTRICVAIVKSIPGFKRYSRHCKTVTRDLKAWCKTYWKKYRSYRESTDLKYVKKASEDNKKTQRLLESREKITKAVNLLLKQGKHISQKAIAKAAGVSPHTVKKHNDLLNNEASVKNVDFIEEESFVNNTLLVNKVSFVNNKSVVNKVSFVNNKKSVVNKVSFVKEDFNLISLIDWG